ncbi:MAG: hypothetical protein ACXWK3_00765 [Reyranella sp.]
MKSVRLGLIICFLASPLASAYADDASYCEALSTSYRKLIGAAQEDAIAADAMAKCKAGNTAAGIPVLEKFLKEGKVTLPPRT